MKVSIDKQYRTRDGSIVRILCTDGPDAEKSVIGFIGNNLNVTNWGLNGQYIYSDIPTQSSNDLVEVPKIFKVDCILSIYANGDCIIDGPQWLFEEDIQYNKVANIFIDCTVSEGEGL